tara:strand:- start:156 stop:410 length:255 start_codon:yes stop_codon:yes gene_type:complete
MIFENIIAVNGTIKPNELAFNAPIFEEAKKYKVFANDMTTTDNKSRLLQYKELKLIMCIKSCGSQKKSDINDAIIKLQKLNVRK